MDKIEHNGSTTGHFQVDPATGVYFTKAQPNGNFVSRVLQGAWAILQELRK